MKTISLTDDQFDTLFEYVDNKVTTIVNASVDYQDSELLQEWEDLFDTHSVLVRVEEEYQNKMIVTLMQRLVMVHTSLNNIDHLILNDKSNQFSIINFFVVHLSQDITEKNRT